MFNAIAWTLVIKYPFIYFFPHMEHADSLFEEKIRCPVETKMNYTFFNRQ